MEDFNTIERYLGLPLIREEEKLVVMSTILRGDNVLANFTYTASLDKDWISVEYTVRNQSVNIENHQLIGYHTYYYLLKIRYAFMKYYGRIFEFQSYLSISGTQQTFTFTDEKVTDYCIKPNGDVFYIEKETKDVYFLVNIESAGMESFRKDSVSRFGSLECLHQVFH